MSTDTLICKKINPKCSTRKTFHAKAARWWFLGFRVVFWLEWQCILTSELLCLSPRKLQFLGTGEERITVKEEERSRMEKAPCGLSGAVIPGVTQALPLSTWEGLSQWLRKHFRLPVTTVELIIRKVIFSMNCFVSQFVARVILGCVLQLFSSCCCTINTGPDGGDRLLNGASVGPWWEVA